MPATEYRTVIDTIQEHYDNIFNAEKKVADFILSNPEKAVNANVSELASFSGVSDATVIRFCKHIGYQGYYQLRINLSRDIGRKQVPQISLEGDAENAVMEKIQSMASDLLAVGKNLNPQTLLECVNMIKSCKQVHIIAVGNTSPLSQYMGFRLGRLGIKCTYNVLPEYFMNHVNLADPEDIVMAISQSGSSKQVVQAMELAKDKGLQTIAITAYMNSPVSNLADLILLSSVEEGSTFDYYKSYSHFYETAVIDILLHFLTNEEKIISSSADIPEMILSETKL
jgi:DNA-binding MurR/RpiR family transcriptional regulator